MAMMRSCESGWAPTRVPVASNPSRVMLASLDRKSMVYWVHLSNIGVAGPSTEASILSICRMQLASSIELSNSPYQNPVLGFAALSTGFCGGLFDSSSCILHMFGNDSQKH